MKHADIYVDRINALMGPGVVAREAEVLYWCFSEHGEERLGASLRQARALLGFSLLSLTLE